MAETGEIRSVGDIPGWFPWLDQRVFEHFLGPDAYVPKGDVVELGVYLGKSAALIGNHLGAGETFTVVDLFGNDPDDAANERENRQLYSELSRAAFEKNYLALHDTLPVVVEGLSSIVVDHVAAESARFVHVDASHLYDHVVTDVESARRLLVPDGVVCFDDYRSAHTPGVAAAVWAQVAADELHPICVTPQKLYGTFGDPAPHIERVRAWAEGTSGVTPRMESIRQRPMVRLRHDAPKKSADAGSDAVTAALKQIDARLTTLERDTKRVDKTVRSIAQRPDVLSRVARRVRAARRR